MLNPYLPLRGRDPSLRMTDLVVSQASVTSVTCLMLKSLRDHEAEEKAQPWVLWALYPPNLPSHLRVPWVRDPALAVQARRQSDQVNLVLKERPREKFSVILSLLCQAEDVTSTLRNTTPCLRRSLWGTMTLRTSRLCLPVAHPPVLLHQFCLKDLRASWGRNRKLFMKSQSLLVKKTLTSTMRVQDSISWNQAMRTSIASTTIACSHPLFIPSWMK